MRVVASLTNRGPGGKSSGMKVSKKPVRVNKQRFLKDHRYIVKPMGLVGEHEFSNHIMDASVQEMWLK